MTAALIETIFTTLLETVLDVMPLAAILAAFQFAVLRERIPHFRQVMIGLVYVIVGLALFLVGLKEALFPLGRIMAAQLTDPGFLAGAGGGGDGGGLSWRDYYWVYIFAAMIGFSTTIAEPALMAVARKANEVSGGTVDAWGLRIAVAIGVAISVAVGTFRIVTGTPLYFYIIVGYAIVLIQTIFAPRLIVPLAYDSGGVTTSTVTVPLVTALGLGLAATVPGRSVLLDGFGLIALASLFPLITVMGYAQISDWMSRRASPAGPANRTRNSKRRRDR